MSDQGPQKPLGPLEPPEGMTFYNTASLAGKKRQRDEDDIDGDEHDTTTLTDATVNNTQTQHINQEDNPGNSSDIVNTAATRPGTPAVKEKEAVRVNITITKNEVRNGDNGLEVKDNDAWYPAIYHHEFVRNILGRDALYGPTGSQQYTHKRADGKLDGDEYDRTSYVPAQKNWGKDRKHRPSILFELKKPDNAYPATSPPNITCPVGGVRRTVIDVINNKPLRNFGHIPITVSTKVEGWLQEAWFRFDPSLRFEDLIQRMPFKAKHKVYESRAAINRLVRRRELFRDAGRCLSWTKTNWTKKWDLYLISQMSKYPHSLNPNSTRHLQDLPTDKKTALAQMIKDSKEFLSKGKHRALKGERREEKDRDIERTLASDLAKEIKAALDQVSSGSVTISQAPKKRRRTSSKRKQAIRNTTAVQPQQNVDPDPRVASARSMFYSNLECVNPRMTGNLDVNEDAHLAHGDPGYYMPARDPLAMEYPAGSEITGNMAHTQPQFDAPGQQRQTQNIQGMQPPRQQFMRPADHQGRADVFGATEQIQGGYDYHAYGDELGDFFSAVPSLLTATTAGSSEGSRRSLSQPPNPARRVGPMGGDTRSQLYLAQPHDRVGRDRGLIQSQPRHLEQPSWQPHDGADLRAQFYYAGPYTGRDANGAEFGYVPSAYDNRGLLQRSSILEAQSSLMPPPPPPPQQIGFTYVDDNRHAWREIGPNGRALENNAYYVGGNPDPSASTPRNQQTITTNEIGQQTGYSFQRDNVPAGLGRTSRKREAPAESDDDLVDSSRKSRKMK